MGKRTIKNINELKLFKKILNKTIKTDKLILFGSRVKGTHSVRSDYDFIVVSPQFEGISWEKRQTLLYPLWDFKMFSNGADFLCYTPSEFRNKVKKTNICSIALKEGLEI